MKLLRGAQLVVEITDLRFLTPDVAIIHARGGLAKPGRRPSRRTRANTSVAVRTDDGWLLAATQNTTHRRFAQKLLTAAAARRAIPTAHPDEELPR